MAYGVIGVGIGLLLGIWALVVADSVKARAVIGCSLALILFLPILWRTRAGMIVSSLSGTIFGIACFIYIKWSGEGPGWR